MTRVRVRSAWAARIDRADAGPDAKFSPALQSPSIMAGPLPRGGASPHDASAQTKKHVPPKNTFRQKTV